MPLLRSGLVSGNLVTGVETVISNIVMMDARLASGLNRGLRLAGLALQRESQILAPVEFGLMRASAYTRAEGSGWKTEVFVGYTSRYALYVHEQVAMKLKGLPRVPNPPHKGNYWDPQSRAQAKFLEAPARTMADALRKIIVGQMKIL